MQPVSDGGSLTPEMVTVGAWDGNHSRGPCICEFQNTTLIITYVI